MVAQELTPVPEDTGLTTRDIGWVIGISHQRAHQLTSQ
jgi:hypothetical protein